MGETLTERHTALQAHGVTLGNARVLQLVNEGGGLVHLFGCGEEGERFYHPFSYLRSYFTLLLFGHWIGNMKVLV